MMFLSLEEEGSMIRRFLFIALTLYVAGNLVQAQSIDVRARELPRADKAPRIGSFHDSGRDLGFFYADINMEKVTGDYRCLGVENTPTLNDWWITGAKDLYGAFLYQVSYNGKTLKKQYPQGNSSWGWRDLAYDGAYLYASDSYVIEQIDPTTGLTTGVTTPAPTSPARALAYDPVTDSFWTANFDSDIFNVNRNGTYYTYDNPSNLSIYGMAMDTINDVLWTWSQEGSGTLASAFDPRAGTFTGTEWDGGSAPYAGTSGGCCIYEDSNMGTVFAGMHQSTPDNVAIYDILPDPKPKVDIKCNDQDGGVIVAQVQKVRLAIDIEARQGAGHDADVWCIIDKVGGTLFSYNGSNWNSGFDSVYSSGPLSDVTDTVLNSTLPLGNYIAYIAIDTIANGVLDMGSLYRTDSVDFEVMKVEGFSEDFEDGFADDWIDDGPHWFVSNGVYFLDAPSFAHWVSYYDFDYYDFTYIADIMMVDTGHLSNYFYYGLFFRSDGTLDNCYTMYTMNSGSCYLYKYIDGVGTPLYTGTFVNMNTGPGNWNNFAVNVRGATSQVYCNGVLEFTISDIDLSSGKVGLRGEGSNLYDHDYQFDNVSLSL